MSDQRHWEKKFVDRYVVNIRRPRYKTCLPSEGNRWSALRRLDHCDDFDPRRMSKLQGDAVFAEGLRELLESEGVNDECWLMSADDEIDGRNCSLVEGVELVTVADSGTVLICPPRPIAVYRPEASEMALYLLK